MFENKKILVLGLAKSGLSVCKLLGAHNEIIATDMKEQDDKTLQKLGKYHVTFKCLEDPTDLLDESFDMVIKNPGIMPTHKTVVKAKELNIPVLNEMEVAYHFIPDGTFIIGITGSNGKTTTTTLIYDMLKLMHKDVVLGGNIGIPLCDIVKNLKKDSILLLEISDHQLINFHDFKTNISVLTNICPTHLDYHGTYEKYMQVKKNIFNNHTENDINIINKTNVDSLKITGDIIGKKIYFNDEENYIMDDGIYVHNKKVINLSDIKLQGRHNYENILAALLVIDYFGIDEKVVKDYLGKFNGVEHRLEFVQEKDGVKYYNDSKATNPTSTVIALNSFAGNVHLILGGMDRSQDFHELDNVIDKCKVIYAIGQTSDKVVSYAEEKNIKCFKCVTLKEAMKKAQEEVVSGDILLLSPASASWDQYPRFEDRGDEFKALCQEIK